MRKRQVQEIEARMLTQKQAETYAGMGKTAFTAWAEQIGARRKIGRKVLYDRQIIDRAFDEMHSQA